MDKRYPLDGHGFANGHVTISPVKAQSRLSVRAGKDAVAPLSAALGLDLPVAMHGVTQKGDRAAFRLGPDEWLVIDASGASLADAVKGVAAPHAAVDVSERTVAILVSGARAATALSCACPQDLSDKTFAVGTARRTLFGKAEVVLWRKAADIWHVECWRSFSPYVFELLEEGARDAAIAA